MNGRKAMGTSSNGESSDAQRFSLEFKLQLAHRTGSLNAEL